MVTFFDYEINGCVVYGFIGTTTELCVWDKIADDHFTINGEYANIRNSWEAVWRELRLYWRQELL